MKNLKQMKTAIVVISPLIIFIFLNFRSAAGVAGRDFSSQSLCDGDCSPQVGDNSSSGLCQIYNTSVCEQFDLGQWTNFPIEYSSSESKANFQVTVIPYEGKYIPEQIYNSLAINISLRSNIKEINGFLVELLEEVPSQGRFICRIFDFRQASRIKRRKFSLYYDCLQNFIARKSIPANSVHTFKLKLRALPINEELQYMMYFQDVDSKESKDACLYKPLILLFLSSLKMNTVSIKFSKAPSFYDLRKYKVSLISVDEDQNRLVVESKLLDPETDSDMMHTDFTNVDIGNYYIHVTPLTWKDNCNGTQTNSFFVSSERMDLSIGYIVGLLILGILLVFGSFILARWCSQIRKKSSVPSVLLVYPCVACHVAVAYAFKWVLQHFDWKVSLVYGEGDASEWLYNKYMDSTAVILLCSPVHSSIPSHPWADRFHPTLEFLKFKIFGDCSFHSGGKKLAMVYFDYSDRKMESVVKLTSHGKLFEFPKDLDEMLFYVSGMKFKFSCFNSYRSSSKDMKSFCEGQEFLMRIKHAEETMKSEASSTSCQICRNEDEKQQKFFFHSCIKCKGYPLNQTAFKDTAM